MHLARQIADETVEREQRWVGHESAETCVAGTIDSGGIALEYPQRNVANDSEGGCSARSYLPLTEGRDCCEKELKFHL